MIHCYVCKECGKKTEIDKPLAEQYIPNCCDKPMAKEYKVYMNINKLKRRD